MNQSYTAVVKQSGSWWIGWVEEIPGVNCQEHTRAELLESLRVTLVEAVEMNRDEARQAAGAGYEAPCHVTTRSMIILRGKSARISRCGIHDAAH